MGMSKPPKVASRPAGGLRGSVSAPAGYGAAPRSKKYVSEMKKKYYLKLKDMLITANVSVDGRFSDSSGV